MCPLASANGSVERAEQAAERRTQRESLQNQEKQLITDWNTADHELSSAEAPARVAAMSTSASAAV